MFSDLPIWLPKTAQHQFYIYQLKHNEFFSHLLSLLQIDLDFCLKTQTFTKLEIEKFCLIASKICCVPVNLQPLEYVEAILKLPEEKIVKYNKLWRIHATAARLAQVKAQYILFIDYLLGYKPKALQIEKISTDQSYDLDCQTLLFTPPNCNFFPVSYTDVATLDLYCKSIYNLESNFIVEMIKFCLANKKKGSRYTALDDLKLVNTHKAKFSVCFGDYRLSTNNEALARDIQRMIEFYEYNFENFYEIPSTDASSKREGIVTRSMTKEKAEEKKERTKVPAGMRHDLWEKYFKEIVGVCFCCEKEIKNRRFEAGHIISVANKGATELDNLLPICFDCNRSMGKVNMDEYINKYYPKNKMFKNRH